ELVPTSMTARRTLPAEGEGEAEDGGESGFKRFHKSHVAEARLRRVGEFFGTSGAPGLVRTPAPLYETGFWHFPFAGFPAQRRGYSECLRASTAPPVMPASSPSLVAMISIPFVVPGMA